MVITTTVTTTAVTTATVVVVVADATAGVEVIGVVAGVAGGG